MRADRTARDASLDAFFAPRAIAIVGASDDATKIGGRPLRYLLDLGFTGTLLPVNPHRSTVQGLPAYARVDDIPLPFDHALIAVATDQVESALIACAKKGARGATIFTSGYAEIGKEGRRAQDRLVEVARAHGMRLLGPNCQGYVNVADRAFVTFSSGIERAGAAPGPAAVISQSGVLSAVLYALLREAGAGVSQWINTGNEADIDAAAALRYALRRDDVRVAAVSLETVRDGDAFVGAVSEGTAAGKSVFVLKGGRSQAGATASLSHTGALLGPDEWYDALFRSARATRVPTMQSLVDAVSLATRLPALPRAKGALRLAVLTNSGGASILIADAAADVGLSVPPLPPAVRNAVTAMLPPYAVAQNPLDLTGAYITRPELLDACADRMVAGGDFDVLLVYLGIVGRLYDVDGIRASFQRLARRRDVPVIVVWQAGDPQLGHAIGAMGLPVFDDIERAVAACAAVGNARSADRTRDVPAAAAVGHLPDARRIAGARRNVHGVLAPADARDLLAAYGIATPPGSVCRDIGEVAAVVARLEAPFVAKVESADIAHKTEVGGVRLRLRDVDDAERAFRDILDQARRGAPDAALDGVRFERTVSGHELIVGATRDTALGRYVTVGAGGVLVALLEDRATERLPLRAGDAAAMLSRLRVSRVLDGLRGRPAADRDAVVRVLEAWSRLLIDLGDEWLEAEINPLIVGPAGSDAIAADVFLRLRSVR